MPNLVGIETGSNNQLYYQAEPINKILIYHQWDGSKINWKFVIFDETDTVIQTNQNYFAPKAL